MNISGDLQENKINYDGYYRGMTINQTKKKKGDGVIDLQQSTEKLERQLAFLISMKPNMSKDGWYSYPRGTE